MTNEDEERRALIHKFYQLYRPLQKRHNLRLYSHFSIYDDGFIEIWEYKGDQRKKCVCKVKEESDIDCYKRTIEMLESYGERRKNMALAI